MTAPYIFPSHIKTPEPQRKVSNNLTPFFSPTLTECAFKTTATVFKVPDLHSATQQVYFLQQILQQTHLATITPTEASNVFDVKTPLDLSTVERLTSDAMSAFPEYMLTLFEVRTSTPPDLAHSYRISFIENPQAKD